MNDAALMSRLHRLRAALAALRAPQGSDDPAPTLDEALAALDAEVAAVLRDIPADAAASRSDRAPAESLLQARNALLRQVVARIPLGILVIELDGTISSVEGAPAALPGAGPQASVGRSVFDVFAAFPDDLAYMRRALAGADVHWTSDALGSTVEVWMTPRHGAAGAVTGAVGLVVDVSDYTRSAAALREREAMLREIIAHVPILLFALDAQGVITCTAGRALELIGEAPGATVGRSIFAVRQADPAELRAVRQALAGEPASWVSAEPPFLDSRVVPLRDAAGTVVGAVGVALDITEQRRADEERRAMERRLLEAQKLESLGLLAGGVAHDFNNLLQSILGNAEGARHALDTGGVDDVRVALGHIEATTRRAADLTRQLLGYAGIGRVTTAVVDLNAVVRDATEMTWSSVAKRASIQLQLADMALPVAGDVTQLHQILVNLVFNAAEAVAGDHGTITITTGRATLSVPSPLPHLSDPLAPGDYATLLVTDTGLGIAEDDLPRIFEPFFSTKVAGRGLGLAAVRGIARSAGGAVQVSTAPGQGSTFTVFLPLHAAAPAVPLAPPAPPEHAETTAWTPSGTVLVVDDDSAVRDVAARNLRRMGFTTLSASSGQRALDVFRAQPDEIVAVLLDRMMPQGDGMTAARALRALAPDLVIVLMTGYNETGAAALAIEHSLVTSVLFKPFSFEQLRASLRAALAP